RAGFPRCDEQVRVRRTACRVRQEHGAGGSKVEVRSAERCLVERSEEVDDLKPRRHRDFEQRVAEVDGSIEIAVAGRKIQVSGKVDWRRFPRCPKARADAVWTHVQYRGETEIAASIRREPAVPRRVVAASAKGDIRHAVGERQPGALLLPSRIEKDGSAARASAIAAR